MIIYRYKGKEKNEINKDEATNGKVKTVDSNLISLHLQYYVRGGFFFSITIALAGSLGAVKAINYFSRRSNGEYS